MNNNKKCGFTLPGESGYEKLTLDLAKRWGADVIRDSDGTALSPEILQSGYGIYSTICVIREHNAFLKNNPQFQQQCLLMTLPTTAQADDLKIDLMMQYSHEQFCINETIDSLKYWQVFDRTLNVEVPKKNWQYNKEDKCVHIAGVTLWHTYTVNFFAFRIWEEISMYNHVTNNWNSEHLMQIDPIYPEAQKYLFDYMEKWCISHPHTTVVRFTSLFYNFAWIWGKKPENRNLYTDWAGYDFTVSPRMLDLFEKENGYNLTSEDFIKNGVRCSCHLTPDNRQLDYMSFVNKFVVDTGKKLVDMVHQHNKEAYLFYDDSWVGVEPNSHEFSKIGFDGIIKCVFSGYEARLCSAVDSVETHELRLHPYLFPVGLGGAPTFAEGGHPEIDTMNYWVKVRRALLRKPVQRIGLGGYLHLTEEYPEFLNAMDTVVAEFNEICQLHNSGKVKNYKGKIGILTAYGKMRSWTCGGHYHEHPELDLLNILESLAGLPFDVEFLSPNDICNGVANDIKVIINAGFEGSAWSGGAIWKDEKLVSAITKFVYEGGSFLGVNEPSALQGRLPIFRLSQILAVEKQHGMYLAHDTIKKQINNEIMPFVSDFDMPNNGKVRIVSESVNVLKADDANNPLITINYCKNGSGVYFSGYRHTESNSKLLEDVLCELLKVKIEDRVLCNNSGVECHIFEESKKLVVVNNNHNCVNVSVEFGGKVHKLNIQALKLAIVSV